MSIIKEDVYVSPLRVRIRKCEKKIEKLKSRRNSLLKLKDTYVQATNLGTLTPTECEIALLVHHKIMRDIDVRLFSSGRELNALKGEKSQAISHDISVRAAN